MYLFTKYMNYYYVAYIFEYAYYNMVFIDGCLHFGSLYHSIIAFNIDCEYRRNYGLG